jgi:hypothetical protein
LVHMLILATIFRSYFPVDKLLEVLHPRLGLHLTSGVVSIHGWPLIQDGA